MSSVYSDCVNKIPLHPKKCFVASVHLVRVQAASIQLLKSDKQQYFAEQAINAFFVQTLKLSVADGILKQQMLFPCPKMIQETQLAAGS